MKSLQILHIGFILLCLNPFTLQASECANVFSMQADQLTDKIPQFFKGLGYSPSKQNLFHSVPEFFRSHIKRGKSFLILRKGEIMPEKVSFVSFKYPEGEQPILTVKNKKGKLLNLSFQDINSIGHENTINLLLKKADLIDKLSMTIEPAFSFIESIYPHSLREKFLTHFKGKLFHKGEDFEIFMPSSFFKNEEKMKIVNETKQAVEKFKSELKNSEFLNVKNRTDGVVLSYNAKVHSRIIIYNTPSTLGPAYAFYLKSNHYTSNKGLDETSKEENIIVINFNTMKSRMIRRQAGNSDVTSVALHEISHNYLNALTFKMIEFPGFETTEEALADYMPHLYAGQQPMEGRNFKNLNVTLYGNRTVEGFDLLSPNIPRSKKDLDYHRYSIFISHFLYQMEQILGREIMKTFFRDFTRNLIRSSDKLEEFVDTTQGIKKDREIYKPIIEVFYALAVFSRTLDKDTTHDSQKIKQAQEFLTQFKEELGKNPFISDILSSK